MKIYKTSVNDKLNQSDTVDHLIVTQYFHSFLTGGRRKNEV